MKRIAYYLAIVMVLAISFFSYSNSIIYVDVNGPNDPGTGSFIDPFIRIQDALNVALDGQTIEIRPGLYTGDGNYNLDPIGKSITIRSSDPNEPDIVENTIIDPNKAGRGFYFHSGEDSNCIVAGLTVKNGYHHFSGGGIFCKDSSPMIEKVTVINNEAGSYGGGIFCDSLNSPMASAPKIIGCLIRGNKAQYAGGAGGRFDGNLTLSNCIIVENEASNRGGGLEFYNCTDVNVINCTMAGNIAGISGGGIGCEKSIAAISNCIIWGNSASKGPQITMESLINSPSTVSVNYTNLQGGQTEIHIDPCSTLVWGAGNTDIDPCFAVFDPNNDPNIWDFHLKSQYGRWNLNTQEWINDVNTSPCIDTGDPNLDWSEESWPNGKRINMGAYGGTSQASRNGDSSDFNVNGEVNFEDFAILAGRWMDEGDFIEDLSNNGKVDYSDFNKFTQTWLWQKEE